MTPYVGHSAYKDGSVSSTTLQPHIIVLRGTLGIHFRKLNRDGAGDEKRSSIQRRTRKCK